MIKIENIAKTYKIGEIEVRALRGVSLEIKQGEFAAIVGPSGSGKSTLMHILGLLDSPDSGSYKLHGKEVSNLSQDELSGIRNSEIGFVFQQFNLLSRTTARDNVSLPLLYSGRAFDASIAEKALKDVGLGDRIEHKPNELSGGQQQRVAVARALVNNPSIIFADEPTGNLDSVSGREVMNLLLDLHRKGLTIVIVTHDANVAAQAQRIVHMYDGKVESQKYTESADKFVQEKSDAGKKTLSLKSSQQLTFREIIDHFKQASRALLANKVRTGLSMLGILIGVSAVITMTAIGSGAQISIKERLSSLGTNILALRPGSWRSRGISQGAGAVTRFTLDDVRDIKESVSSAKYVAPTVRGNGQVVYGNKNWSTTVYGSTPDYALMKNNIPQLGRFFTDEEVTKRSRAALIGVTVLKELFEGKNPIGENIKINKVNFQIIGVLPEKGASMRGDDDDVIIIPVTTAMKRLMGKDYVDAIEIEIDKQDNMETASEEIKKLIIQRHRLTPSQYESFDIRNYAEIQEAVSSTSKVMSILLASIAAISLLVGGIGIMNIMLVSVTERTREIGLRKAIGARNKDVLTQFLIEALVIGVAGGLMGILLGALLSFGISIFAGWPVAMTSGAVLTAFVFSAAVGAVFGLWPARKAADLNPIDALRYE